MLAALQNHPQSGFARASKNAAILSTSCHKRALASLAGDGTVFASRAREKLERLRAELEPLARRYDVVVANPPYMGSGNMNKWLGGWAKEAFKDAKSDLCTCFIERGRSLAITNGYVSMITASSWMFISSFEAFRKKLLATSSICSMIQQSTHGYAGVTVPTTMFVLAEDQLGVIGSYIRLEDFDRPQWQEPKALEALANPDCGWFHRANTNDFEAIPGSPVAYWASKTMINAFSRGKCLKEYAYGCNGITTGDNAQFLRQWFELSISSIGLNLDAASCLDEIDAWVPYNKGGEFQKWAAHLDYVINWNNGGADIKEFGHLVMRSKKYMLMPGYTWPKISSGHIAVRRVPKGFMFDVAGLSLFPNSKAQGLIYEALINSSVGSAFLAFLSPTLNFEVGNVTAIPILETSQYSRSIIAYAETCCELVEQCRDSFETSWRFKRHQLI